MRLRYSVLFGFIVLILIWSTTPLAVKWSGQGPGFLYIASGFISVIFGMTPILTGIFARFLLAERTLSPLRVFGMLLSLIGLALIFHRSVTLGHTVVMGVVAVVMGVLLHSIQWRPGQAPAWRSYGSQCHHRRFVGGNTFIRAHLAGL